MKFTLVRQIYFHSPETGLVSKYVSKDVNSEVSPQIGYEFEDSAWHRNDPIKSEAISINSETGKCTVSLNPKLVGIASDVDRFYEVVVKHHGWKDWFAN